MTTADQIRKAKKGLDGLHPLHDFPIQDGEIHAVGHALLALVSEQQTTNSHLAGIASSLDRIAAALERQAVAPTPGTAPESKRSFWLPSRRNN
jgi:hypothetical protein